MVMTGRAARRVNVALRWIARIAGTALLIYYVRQGAYEATRLATEKWVYGDRIFSVGFLAMLGGIVLGWLADRGAAVLLVGGYLLAAGAPFLGEARRPMLGAGPGDVAVVLLPFLLVGIVYAYAGRTREPAPWS
jgi:hypothetical protein